MEAVNTAPLPSPMDRQKTRLSSLEDMKPEEITKFVNTKLDVHPQTRTTLMQHRVSKQKTK